MTMSVRDAVKETELVIMGITMMRINCASVKIIVVNFMISLVSVEFKIQEFLKCYLLPTYKYLVVVALLLSCRLVFGWCSTQIIV